MTCAESLTEKATTLKRILVLTMILSLVFGSIATADAGKKKKREPKRVVRVVEVTYDGPAIGVGAAGAGVCLGALNSCGLVPIGDDDKFLEVEVTDTSGTTVQLSLGQDTDEGAVGTEVDLGAICGASTESIAIQAPGVPITTFPWAIGGPDCLGVATTGTITFRFSNLP